MKTYLNEMKKCIKLAKTAQGHTSPNPLVGCIILNKKNKIISTGIHIKYGENHAERNALNKLESAQDCTLIVNLEPCCHQGKTPPCTDIIIEKGVKRVVYGMKDPNPLVSGLGLQKLKDAGIEVIGPVLKKECEELNEVFIKNQTQQKPFIAIKTATTIDGKIATRTGDSKWITSSKALNRRKYIRNRYDALLTSSSTILADNPTMEFKKKIILDRELKTDFSNAQIYKQGEIFVFYDSHKHLDVKVEGKVTFIPTPVKNQKLDIEFIINKTFELGIMSFLVEAGGGLNASFLPYADKIYQFIAPKILGDNSGKSCFNGEKVNKISDCTQLKLTGYELYSPDILLTYAKA